MNKNKRLVLATVMVGAMVASAFAANERRPMTFLGGVDVAAGGLKLASTEVTATAAELNIMDGVTATASEINAAADASASMTTAILTNGMALTLSAATPTVVVTSWNQADTFTNTVTLATPYPVGVLFTLIMAGGNTNVTKIADSTTVLSLGADVILGATDTLTFFTTATNAAAKISTSDN